MDYFASFEKLTAEVKPAALMAVSKTRSLEEVQSAYQAGYRLFGENHVQEIVEKFSVWKPADVKVHMIGHLQSNKVNKVVPLADMIESVDSLSLLEKINNSAGSISKVMDVLLEFNTSGEEAKSGFESEKDLFECLDKAGQLKNIKICGLMTVGPVDCPAEKKDELTKKAFEYLVQLRDKCRKQYPDLNFDVLSMGMSGDYKLALECGSTQVRIGTAIFGERHYV